MTYRERRAAKADRLREWADKRETRADGTRKRVDAIADGIPFGQPILVGHHSEARARRDQDRIHSGMRRSIDDYDKAAEFRRRADNIERAADNAVYSDDVDAIARLEARVAKREAERDRIKAFNAKVRKAGRVTSEALDELGEDLGTYMSVAQTSPMFLGKLGQFPSYHLTNLGATIRKDRKRLEALKQEVDHG